MRKISVSDVTVRWSDRREPLSFRISISLAKLLDSLGVDVVEAGLVLDKTDYFLVKSIASAVRSAGVAVPVDIMDPDSPARTWDALRDADSPRLQVPVPVSTVQMEYVCHRKPADMLGLISERVAACRSLCPDVEFVAMDCTRSDEAFFKQAVGAAVDAGAGRITLCDQAGTMLPNEFQAYVSSVREWLPAGVGLGVQCSDSMFLADACSVAAVLAGADEVKTVSSSDRAASLEHFARILASRSEDCGACCAVVLTELGRVASQMNIMQRDAERVPSAGDPSDARDDEIRLTVRDSMQTVVEAVRKLGYELSEEDDRKIYDAFVRLSSNNETIGAKELDAIAATTAYQVPSTYKLESFVINTGNILTPTCHIRLLKGEEILENVCVGEGPIDAAFLSVDKAIGCHYELDDFQIRSVTEGREAMGETVVRLRHEGKVYSGRGVSKDIVASSLMAYLNAVNKIAYEESLA